MPKGFPARNSRFTLRHRLNLLLAERGAPMRIVEARNNAERAILGDHYFVGHPNRHVIVCDHVDLYRLADEIGAL